MRLAFIINSRNRQLHDFEVQFQTCDHGLILKSTRFYTLYPKHAIELSEQAGEYDILEVDGELAGHLPVEIRCLPEALNFYYPDL